MEVTPRARSPKLGSPRVWRIQVQLPTTPSWMGRQPWGCAHENVTHTARDAQANTHTGRALHRLMPLKHSWTLGSGPHPYSINGTLTSATASD